MAQHRPLNEQPKVLARELLTKPLKLRPGEVFTDCGVPVPEVTTQGDLLRYLARREQIYRLAKYKCHRIDSGEVETLQTIDNLIKLLIIPGRHPTREEAEKEAAPFVEKNIVAEFCDALGALAATSLQKEEKLKAGVQVLEHDIDMLLLDPSVASKMPAFATLTRSLRPSDTKEEVLDLARHAEQQWQPSKNADTQYDIEHAREIIAADNRRLKQFIEDMRPGLQQLMDSLGPRHTGRTLPPGFDR